MFSLRLALGQVECANNREYLLYNQASMVETSNREFLQIIPTREESEKYLRSSAEFFLLCLKVQLVNGERSQYCRIYSPMFAFIFSDRSDRGLIAHHMSTKIMMLIIIMLLFLLK